MAQEDENIFKRIWGSDPVQKFFNYDEFIRDEAIQRAMETTEAFDKGGFTGGMAHIGREYASDIAGLPTALVGKSNPLAEWLDPSENTEIGARAELQYQKHRQAYGRDPSMAEKYDILQGVQNEINPWLAETKKVAGFDITNRGLIGAPVTAAAIAGEIALTAGMAGLAKTLGKRGVKEAVEKSPGTIAGQAAEGAKNVARETARQGLLIPKRIDDLVALTLKTFIGKPIQYGYRGVAGVAKGGKFAFDAAFNRAAGKANEAGIDPALSTPQLTDAAGNIIKQPYQPTSGAAPKNFDVPEREPSIFDGAANKYDEIENISNVNTWRNKVIRLFGRSEDLTPEEQLGKKVDTELKDKDDAFRNIIDGMSTNDSGQFSTLLGTLMRRFPKTFVSHGSSGKVVYGGDLPENIVVLNGDLIDRGLLNSTTTFDKELPITEAYAVELDRLNIPVRRPDANQQFAYVSTMKSKGAGIGDILERFEDGTFDEGFKLLKTSVDDELIAAWGDKAQGIFKLGENGVIKYKGEEMSAHEILAEMRNILQKYEKVGVQEGAVGSGIGQYVNYVLDANGKIIQGAGGAAMPRKMLKAPDPDSKGRITAKWLDDDIAERKILTEAEAISLGNSIANPKISLESRIRFMGKTYKQNRQADFLRRSATKFNIRYGTLDDLVGRNFYDDIRAQYSGITKALQDQGLYSKGGPSALSKAAIKEVDDLVAKIDNIDLEAKFKLDAVDKPTDSIKAEITKLENSLKEIDNDIEEVIAKGKGFNNEQVQEIRKLVAMKKNTVRSLLEEALEGAEKIGGLRINDYYFPAELASAMGKTIEDLYKLNPDRDSSNIFETINNISRTYSATGDLSAPGIQGMLAMVNDFKTRIVRMGMNPADFPALSQGDSITAVKHMLDAFRTRGEEIMGEYFVRADSFARINGYPTTEDIIRAGGAIRGKAPDLFAGADRWGAFSNLPVLRQFLRKFDLAFTSYGNYIRHSLIQQEMMMTMREKGMTVAELIDSGNAAPIAAAYNKITGVGGTRGFGAFSGGAGQFLIFAPRFFKARLDTLGNFLQGVAKGDEATLEQAIARRMMTSFIGMGTTLTLGINAMTGEETDMNPFKQNEATGEYYFNPNFMRIHLGELDISLFGPWDSILRIISTPVFVARNAPIQGVSPETMYKELRGVLSGPLITKALDLVAGEDAIGQRTRTVVKQDEVTKEIVEKNFWEDPDAALKVGEYLIENLIPFAWDDVLFADPGRESIVGRGKDGVAEILGGNIQGAKEVGTAGAQFVGQFFGVKSTYETLSEAIDEAEAGILELGPSDIRLQEAFGMNEKELGIYLAQHGRGLLKDGSLNIGAGLKSMFLGERTPDFSDIAKDYQKNIQRMQEEGRFPEFFSSEEWKDLEKKYEERLFNSKGDYSEYTIRRNALMDQEQEELSKLENAFKTGTMYENPLTGEKVETGDMQDIATFYKTSRKISASFANRRRSLTDPLTGQFSKLDEFFKFGRETALGKISGADADIYDFSQASYYDKLWGEDSIVMPDGDINWEKREIKLREWAAELKQRYPILSDSEIGSYLYRVENYSKKEAPPLKRAMMEMTSQIQEAGYYDVERNIFYRILNQSGATQDTQENLIGLYTRWKQQTGQDKKALEQQYPILKIVSEAATEQKKIFRMSHPRIDAMLRLVGSTKSKEPLTNYGRVVDYVVSLNRQQPLSEQELLQFFYNLLNQEVDYDQTYSTLFKT